MDENHEKSTTTSSQQPLGNDQFIDEENETVKSSSPPSSRSHLHPILNQFSTNQMQQQIEAPFLSGVSTFPAPIYEIVENPIDQNLLLQQSVNPLPYHQTPVRIIQQPPQSPLHESNDFKNLMEIIQQMAATHKLNSYAIRNLKADQEKSFQELREWLQSNFTEMKQEMQYIFTNHMANNHHQHRDFIHHPFMMDRRYPTLKRKMIDEQQQQQIGNSPKRQKEDNHCIQTSTSSSSSSPPSINYNNRPRQDIPHHHKYQEIQTTHNDQRNPRDMQSPCPSNLKYSQMIFAKSQQ